MAAQFIRSRTSHPELQRYTLVFCNGDLLKHQDPLALAQFQIDARLVEVRPEPGPGSPSRSASVVLASSLDQR